MKYGQRRTRSDRNKTELLHIIFIEKKNYHI